MPTFTITAVHPQTRQYDTKFGPMVSYKLMLTGPNGPEPQAVELGQKSTTPAPTVGQTLDGMIDMSGQYGPKFKKEYGGGGFTQPQTAPQSSTGQDGSKNSAKFGSDPFTMYLSYAKDLIVALQETSGYDEQKFNELLTATIKGGKALYAHRPGAEPTPAVANTPQSPPAADSTAPIDMSELDNIFGPQEEPIDTQASPW